MKPFEHVPTAEELHVYHLTDSELIVGAREGKDAYIGALYHKYGPLVYDAAVRLVPQDAADVVNDVFLDLPRLLAGYSPEEGKFVRWLRQAVFNRARTAARMMRVRARREEGLPSLDLPLPVRSFGRTTEEREVQENVLGELSGLQRAVCELFAAGHTYAEIAAQLGITEANAAVIVARVKKRLNARYRDLLG